MSKTVLFQVIQFSISTQFNFIWPIDITLSGATTLQKSNQCYYTAPADWATKKKGMFSEWHQTEFSGEAPVLKSAEYSIGITTRSTLTQSSSTY